MAKITNKPKVELELTFTINEAEARALDALVGYNYDDFIAIFKEKLGKHYIEKDNAEDGLRLFFESIRKIMPGYLSQLEKAKKAFNE